jgi:D-alanyl-lipoteichoic acid acyltransferase DltB (MBOAT superfamily)
MSSYDYVYVSCIVTSLDDYNIIITYNQIPLSVDIIVTNSIGSWTSGIAYSMHWYNDYGGYLELETLTNAIAVQNIGQD